MVVFTTWAGLSMGIFHTTFCRVYRESPTKEKISCWLFSEQKYLLDVKCQRRKAACFKLIEKSQQLK